MKKIITLSPRERRFIVAAMLHADKTVKELAERTELPERSIRHIQHSLLARGILKPIYKIDVYRLGFTDFRIYLGNIAEPSRVRTEFEKRVLQYPQVYWIAKTNGAYQYAITFLAQDPGEMIDFFPAVQPPRDGFYAERTVSIAGTWSVYAPSYLAPEVESRDVITLDARERAPKLEETDHRILAAMAKNPTASYAELARRTSMSASSFAYRAEKLTKERIIRGQMYMLNAALLGLSVYRLTIVERGLSAHDRERFSRYIASHPNVGAFLHCTGAWDYEIRFETENPEVLESFCQTIIDTFGPAIGSMSICQQVSILKRVSYPCT